MPVAERKMSVCSAPKTSFNILEHAVPQGLAMKATGESLLHGNFATQAPWEQSH